MGPPGTVAGRRPGALCGQVAPYDNRSVRDHASTNLQQRASEERHRLLLEVQLAVDALRDALEDEERDDRHRERRRAVDPVTPLQVEQAQDELGDPELANAR